MAGLIGRIFFSATAAAFLWFSPPAEAAPQTETAAPPPAAESDEIQKVINILEDDQRRRDVTTLLKLLATLDQDRAREIINGTENGGADQPPAAAAEPGSVKTALSGLGERVWRNVVSVGPGLRQSWREARHIFDALGSPIGVEMWRPYLLKVFVWALFCLAGALFVIKKFGRLPEACPDRPFAERLKAAAKYVLTVAWPSLTLVLSLLAIPRLSSTAPGVTADLALGFSLIHSFIQFFFINISLLYIFLEMTGTLFAPGSGGRSVVGLHPVLSRHLMRSLRVLAIYLAALVFFKETFMEHFVGGPLFLTLTIALSLPIPAYLTVRLVRFSRLAHAVGEAEASSAMDEEPDRPEDDPDAPPRPRLDYQADLLFKKHWAAVSVVAVWGLWLLFLVNPMDTGAHYAARLLVSLLAAGLAALGVVLSRQTLLRFISQDSENGRRLLLQIDLLLNVLLWPALTAAVVLLWGAPVSRLLENAVIRDILGRGLAIAVVTVALAVFVKFSRAATEWLLSSPDLSRNRNWRTITPLVLTAVRALAVFTGLVVILERLGVNVGPILAGAGILGLGVGMGAQSLVKDLINGVSILLADTLAVGDYVTIGGKSGTVEAVGLRSIRLRDVSGNLTVVPNSLVDTIVNMTRDYSQDIVEFNTPYDADPDAMLQMAREVADELSRDRDWKPRLTDPVSVVGITAFDSNGTTIRMKLNTTAGDQWAVGRELRLRLKRRMLRDGITSTWYGRNVVYFKQHEEDEAAGPPAAPASG